MSHLLSSLFQAPQINPLTHEGLSGYLRKVSTSMPGVEADRGYLLLGHRWQRHMGDFAFDRAAFPRINDTLDMIK